MIWNQQDVILACVGGFLIGLATTLHYLIMGRVTGFSGMFYSVITFDKSIYWKIALLASVSLSASVMYQYYGQSPIISGAGPAFDSISTLSQIGWVGAVVAGFLVGFGTKLGNGCTSGHGVCGLPRLSIRSIVAVACFMGTGVITATIKAQMISEHTSKTLPFDDATISTVSVIASATVIIMAMIAHKVQGVYNLVDCVVAILVGLIFGCGLVVSGMVKRTKIIGFLTVDSNWDPSLIFVMLVAVGMNFITFRLLNHPLLNSKFEIPSNTTVDLKLLMGSSIFGIGWGIGGLCPGPAIALMPEFTLQIGVVFIGALAIGQILAEKSSNSSCFKTNLGHIEL